MLTFPCAQCQKPLRTDPINTGRILTCPHCKATVKAVVPDDGGRAVADLPMATSAYHHPLEDAGDADVWRGLLTAPEGEGEIGRLGGYRVLGVLGQGGMGVVFRAADPMLNREVALKAMLPTMRGEACERFLREARAAAAVEHDHIVSIHQVGEERGVPFLVMPLLKGEALDALLRREKRLPLDEAVRIAREAAEGLHAAHEKGLVHRDIKPGNLWLEGIRRKVKILDFGLACAGDGSGEKLTQSGAILGTPAYMSPEQAHGQKTDARSDVFSLGCVLYRMLTGKTAFRGKDPLSTLMAVAMHHPDAPASLRADVPAWLSDLVMRMLAKEADQRPASAAEVATLLGRPLQPIAIALPVRPEGRAEDMEAKQGEEVLHELPKVIPATLRQPMRKVSSWPGGRVIGVGVAVILGLMLVGAMVVGLFTGRGRREESDATRTSAGTQEGQIPPPVEDRDKKPSDSVGGVDATGSRLTVEDPEIGFRMEFVLVRKGAFLMGSPAEEVGRERYDKGSEQLHKVEISQDFYMGVYEVTQRQWKAIIGNYPSFFSKEGKGKDYVVGLNTEDFPMENISWEDAQTFLNMLNMREKLAKKGWKYRLPTEAQWEYACRGGPVPSSHRLLQSANFANSHKRPCKVGSYKPNALGLYDMLGNVWEWCHDWYDKDYYASSPGRDPTGPFLTSHRAFRGGSWQDYAHLCRPASRRGWWPTYRNADVGFRVALVPAGGTAPHGGKTVVNGGKKQPGRVPALERTPAKLTVEDREIGFRMDFVLVKKGKYLMGSQVREEWRMPREVQHEVEITKDFYMGVYEVTQRQWKTLMGNNPSHFRKNGPGKDKVTGLDTEDFPVDCVSWYDAQAFLKKLNARASLENKGWEYRFPTEAQWEYSCRGRPTSSTRPFHFRIPSDNLSPKQANFVEAKLDRTCKVGSYEPNSLGLYDMHGNVLEWCSDWYEEFYYRTSASRDPVGPLLGTERIVRGGHWGDRSLACRAAARHGQPPSDLQNFLGFRVVLVPSGE